MREKRLLLAEYNNNRYRYYIPNFDAEYFVKRFAEGSETIKLLMAANAYSKTSLATVILANIMWDNRNEFFQYELFRNWPYPKYFWYMSKHTTLKNAVSPEIKKWFPKDRYDLKERDGYPIHLETDTGFVIDFLRYDQSIDSFESATVGMIVKDEPSIEKIYNACISRLRMGGIILWVMTPLMKAAFVKRRILEGNEHAYVHKADVWANSIENRGVLSKKNIEFMISQYSPEELRARAYGELMVLEGLVFKEFSKKYHVVRVEDIERLFVPQVFGKFEEWPKAMIIDPHDRKPDFIIWAALAPDGTWIVYDEYPDRDFWAITSRQDDIKAVLRKCFDKEDGISEKQWTALHVSGKRMEIMRRIMDRRKGAQNVSDMGQDLKDVYNLRAKELGHPVTIKLSFDDKNKIDHSQIHSYLEYNHDESGFLVLRPKLLFMSDCKNTIKGVENYMWDEWNANDDDKKPLREQVQQKYKDPIDCLRYLLGENIKYEPVVQKESMEKRGYRVKENRDWMAV